MCKNFEGGYCKLRKKRKCKTKVNEKNKLKFTGKKKRKRNYGFPLEHLHVICNALK